MVVVVDDDDMMNIVYLRIVSFVINGFMLKSCY